MPLIEAELQKRDEELAKWRAECDKVGVPYDPAGLVRHHRGNAGLAAAADALSRYYPVKQENVTLRAKLKEAVEVLEGTPNSILHRPTSVWWTDHAKPFLDSVRDLLQSGPEQ